MAHHRINITLPTETLHQLDELVAKGDRSRFIHAAIQSHISQIQKQKLRQQLKAGAIHHAERDRQLTDDWFALEEEVWQQNTN
jgi:CopG family transcriptional regulator / antitoxin EndoAI